MAQRYFSDHVFICGCPRSGSTVLFQYLCRAGNAAYFVAAQDRWPWAARAFRRLERLGRLSVDQVGAQWILPGMLLAPSGGARIWNRIWRIESGAGRAAMLREHACGAPPEGGGIFINKRLANIRHIEELARCFPRSHLVHIVRDPVDSVQSLLAMRSQRNGADSIPWGFESNAFAGQGLAPEEECARQWRHVNGLIEQSAALFQSYHCVAYETFCADPAAETKALCTSIGLRMPQSVQALVSTARRYEVSAEARERITTWVGYDVADRLQSGNSRPFASSGIQVHCR
jgi:hypothetical protein